MIKMTWNFLFKNAEVNSKVFICIVILGRTCSWFTCNRCPLRSVKSPETNPHIYTKNNLL